MSRTRQAQKRKQKKNKEISKSFREGFGYTPRTIKIPSKDVWIDY